VDTHYFDCLRASKRWQDRRQALREHRLAGPWRTTQQAVVPAGGRDGQRFNRVAPPAYVLEVEAPLWTARCGSFIWLRQRVGGTAAKHPRGAAQTLDDADPQAVDEHRLACPPRAQEEHPHARLPTGLGNGERAVTRSHFAVERELSEQCTCIQQLAGYLPTGGKYCACER
jgi:hypothetical protein